MFMGLPTGGPMSQSPTSAASAEGAAWSGGFNSGTFSRPRSTGRYGLGRLAIVAVLAYAVWRWW